jgi:hypothetical protein
MADSTPAEAAGTLVIGGEHEVRRLGFGAMRITGPGIWGPPADRDEALAVLRRAVGLGVNFIDTADSYGPDVSEELIAAAQTPGPSTCGRRWRAACPAWASSRSPSTSSTGPTRRSPSRSRWASWSPCRARARSATSACPT